MDCFFFAIGIFWVYAVKLVDKFMAVKQTK